MSTMKYKKQFLFIGKIKDLSEFLKLYIDKFVYLEELIDYLNKYDES